MTWIDAITDSFPPPHEREPRNLRADIRDELADHLECATRRELLKTRDEESARLAALERFGDPKSIARRLWWDAMKERIMKDRLFNIVLLLGTLALVAAFVLPWAAKQSQINEAILEKLTSLTPPAPASHSALPENWCTLKVAVREEGTGRPVKDARVELSGKPFTDADKHELNESTDSQGVVTFGPIRPGPYGARVQTKSEDGLPLHASQTVTLYAGQERQTLFITPKGKVAADVTPHVNGPDYLQKLGCVAVFRVQQKDLRCEDTRWSGFYVSQLAVAIGKDAWADFSQNFRLRSDELSIVRGGNLPCGLPATGRVPLRMMASECIVTRAAIWQPRGNKGSDHCWAELASHELKDLTVSIPPGSFPWELPLPDELLASASKSSLLELPVTFRFSGLTADPEDFLIDVSFSRREIDAKNSAPGSSGDFKLTAGGSLVSKDQFENLSRRSGLVPAMKGNMTLKAPELRTEQSRLPIGQYELCRFGLWKRLKSDQGLHVYEMCGSSSLSEGVQRFEIRVGQENAWAIQLPPDLLKLCAPATMPQ